MRLQNQRPKLLLNVNKFRQTLSTAQNNFQCARRIHNAIAVSFTYRFAIILAYFPIK